MESQALAEYGIDYDKGMRNCMENLPFYKKILEMFLDDTSFSRAKKAFQAAEYRELFKCVHELKGISGNAGLTALYEVCVPLVEALRKDEPQKAEAERLFPLAEAEYRRACEGIALFLAQ